MKRFTAVILVCLLLLLSVAPVSAQSVFTYVTDFGYATIRVSGNEGQFAFGAYEGDDYKIGTLTADGEQSRTDWTADGWNALFAPSVWKLTVHNDASSLCPYAHTHGENTICPFQDVSLVTLTDTRSGAVLDRYYISYPVQHISSSSSVHVCWGRYGYKSPETLKRNGDSARVALVGENGLWGVYDTASQAMLTDFAYQGMIAVYGDYVKVYNGEAWGRLDLTGTYDTVYTYAKETDFSVTEELRQLADGTWQVFNEHNTPISAVFDEADTTYTYHPQSRLVTATAADGSQTLADLGGNTVASFTSTQKITYLEGTCYAVTQYTSSGAVSGVALATAQGALPILYGDVNDDGVCDSADVRLILRFIVDVETFSPQQRALADMNGDGAVDSADVRLLMQQIVE